MIFSKHGGRRNELFKTKEGNEKENHLTSFKINMDEMRNTQQASNIEGRVGGTSMRWGDE